MSSATPLSVPKPVSFPVGELHIGITVDALFEQEPKEHGLYRPGVGLPFIRKMMALNTIDYRFVKLTLFSRGRMDEGLRLHHAMKEHGLFLKTKKGQLRFGDGEAYTKGRPITPATLSNFGVNLFITTDRQEAVTALAAGFAAGQILRPESPPSPVSSSQILWAFDCDRVLFLAKGKTNDRFKQDGEAYFRKRKCLTAYSLRESTLVQIPAEPFAFANVYMSLVQIRSALKTLTPDPVLQLALVTARRGDAAPRVPVTLHHWGSYDAMADIARFCGPTDKAGHLQEIEADIFFDDNLRNAQNAAAVTTSVFVPYEDIPQRGQRKATSTSPAIKNG